MLTLQQMEEDVIDRIERAFAATSPVSRGPGLRLTMAIGSSVRGKPYLHRAPVAQKRANEKPPTKHSSFFRAQCNPLTVEPAAIRDNRVIKTNVDGRLVHEA